MKGLFCLSFQQHQDRKTQWKEAKRRYPLLNCRIKVAIHGGWWQRTEVRRQNQEVLEFRRKTATHMRAFQETTHHCTQYHSAFLTSDLSDHVQETSLVKIRIKKFQPVKQVSRLIGGHQHGVSLLKRVSKEPERLTGFKATWLYQLVPRTLLAITFEHSRYKLLLSTNRLFKK